MPNQYAGAALPNTVESALSLIQRYLDGTTTSSLAQQYGVTRPRLYQILLQRVPEQWRDAQVAHAVERLEVAKHGLDTAEDALSLARARESAKIAQWELERLLHRLYGPKQELTGKDGGPIQVEIVQFGRTIDADTADVGDQPIADAQSSAALPKK